MESKEKKRLLFIITLNEIGGAQRFLSTLISNLDPQKYEIMVAAGDNSTGDFLKSFSPPIHTQLIRNLKRNPNFFTDIKAVFEIRKLIKQFKPDVLFLNSSKAGFLGSLASKYKIWNTKYKILYRIGGWTFNDPWPKWKKWSWIQLEKKSAKWKDIIIVNNKHDFEQAQNLKIKPRQQLTLIYNGLDVYKMDFLPREEARLKLFEKLSKNHGQIFQAKTIIGTIANLYPTKGISNLILAAEQFKDNKEIIFIIIGDGPLMESLKLKVKSLNLENRVFLTGQIKDASRLLNAFDIFVLPSLKEGFPWALIEAMSAKLPVIATSVGAASEIIEDGKNGFLVESGNSEQIAGKIKDILADDHLRLELGIQAHQTILFKFPLDKMIKQTEELF